MKTSQVPVILLLFPDEWIAYSPTVLNLISLLEQSFKIIVISIDTGKYQRPTSTSIRYIYIPLFIARVFELFGLYKLIKSFLLYYHARRLSYNDLIAVDDVGALAAQLLNAHYHYLSLEISRTTIFRKLSEARIKTVITQTSERYNYQFKNLNVPVYFIQNAPTFDGIKKVKKKKNSLIFLGNAIPKHGVLYCIDFINKNPEYSLTIKGHIPNNVLDIINNKYPHLINEKRLLADNIYTDESDIIDYLRPYHIGFALYDLDLIPSDDFNYLSCPSGKLFNYYAAGVPVVGSNIIGMKSITDYGSGKIITNPKYEEIYAALKAIEEDYENIVNNCFLAAGHFSFCQAAIPFKNMLVNTLK